MDKEKTRDKILNNSNEEKMKQMEEMFEIWIESDEVTKAYLKGCLTTACVLASEKKTG